MNVLVTMVYIHATAEYLGRRKTMSRKRISIFGPRAALPLSTFPPPQASVLFQLQKAWEGKSLVRQEDAGERAGGWPGPWACPQWPGRVHSFRRAPPCGEGSEHL